MPGSDFREMRSRGGRARSSYEITRLDCQTDFDGHGLMQRLFQGPAVETD